MCLRASAPARRGPCSRCLLISDVAGRACREGAQAEALRRWEWGRLLACPLRVWVQRGGRAVRPLGLPGWLRVGLVPAHGHVPSRFGRRLGRGRAKGVCLRSLPLRSETPVPADPSAPSWQEQPCRSDGGSRGGSSSIGMPRRGCPWPDLLPSPGEGGANNGALWYPVLRIE